LRATIHKEIDTVPTSEKSLLAYAADPKKLPSVLNEIFHTTNATQWSIPKSQEKDPKKKKEEKPKDKHPNGQGPNKAKLAKGGDYGGAFGAYIRTDAARAKVYNTISPNIAYLYAQSAPALVSFFEKYFKLGSSDSCFNPNATKPNMLGIKRSANKKIPYAWQAHHIIPGEAFTIMKKNRGGSEQVFSDTQYSLLLLSDYDINEGHNIIALPGRKMDVFQPVHDLILHPTNHGEYTSQVVSKMRSVSEDLKEIEEELKEDHPEVVVAIKQQMLKFQDELWDLLIKLGKATVTKKVQGGEWDLSPEEEEMIKYKAKTS
jgi:uncharacterized protein YdcH (DUF465 family)